MSVEEWVGKHGMGTGTGMEQGQVASGMEQRPVPCGMEQEHIVGGTEWGHCGMERGGIASGMGWSWVERVVFIDSTWQQARSILRVRVGREGGREGRGKLHTLCIYYIIVCILEIYTHVSCLASSYCNHCLHLHPVCAHNISIPKHTKHP